LQHIELCLIARLYPVGSAALTASQLKLISSNLCPEDVVTIEGELNKIKKKIKEKKRKEKEIKMCWESSTL